MSGIDIAYHRMHFSFSGFCLPTKPHRKTQCWLVKLFEIDLLYNEDNCDCRISNFLTPNVCLNYLHEFSFCVTEKKAMWPW